MSVQPSQEVMPLVRRSDHTIPLIRATPARVADVLATLEEIEASGIYSNYGPVNQRFEAALIAEMFDGRGQVVTACNATIALMLAIRQAMQGQPATRRYALMPAFTFAATAQAAIWAGLTPLLCDITPDTWLACPESEARLLARYGDQVAVIVGCTTFGNPIDLARYRDLRARHGCALVVDAAAALGSRGADGLQFGTDAPEPIVFSMHATKVFATLEGGVTYAADPARIDALRAMGNFGFVEPRSAALPGLNAKMNEMTAAFALGKLQGFEATVSRRLAVDSLYRDLLPDMSFQRMTCTRYAPVFASLLLPPGMATHRAALRRHLLACGVHSGAYFDPHLGAQPLFRDCPADALPVTDDVAARILTLPVSQQIMDADVRDIAGLVNGF